MSLSLIPATSTPKTPRTTSKPTPRKTAKTPTSITPSKRKQSTLTDDDVAVSEDDSESLDLQNLPRAISRASLARSKKVPKRYEDPDSDVDKADDEGDDVPFKVESKVDAAATGDGEEIHVASAAPRGIDSVMGELMAEAEPKGQNMFGKKAAEWEDESDVSDFAKSFG